MLLSQFFFSISDMFVSMLRFRDRSLTDRFRMPSTISWLDRKVRFLRLLAFIQQSYFKFKLQQLLTRLIENTCWATGLYSQYSLFTHTATFWDNSEDRLIVCSLGYGICRLQYIQDRMSQPDTQQSQSWPGFFRYYYLPLKIGANFQSLTFPQSFASFPPFILFTFLVSNLLKLAVPFTLEYLYLNINPNNVFYPSLKFICIIVLGYYFQLKAEALLNSHILKAKKVLSSRVIKTAFRKPYEELEGNPESEEKTSWGKISGNINIFVYNYYGSYLTLVFETLKAVFIVTYLFSRLGWITFVGLLIGGMVTQFISMISKKIEDSNFKKLRATESKTKILTQYFSRIVDYQMSWLDGFIGDRIEHLEDQYQRNLRKTKLLDAWCVGLWQFTQIGISSVVLCLYYFYYTSPTEPSQSSGSQRVQPATIIYLFQMLTFPMNAISWNIAGLNNAERAIKQLSQSERSDRTLRKKEKAMLKYDFGYQVELIQKTLRPGQMYAIQSQDPFVLRKLSLSLSQKGHKVGYAEQNGFFLPTAIESLLMLSSEDINHELINENKLKMAKALQVAKFEQIPIQNPTSTFSGGEKMRMSLARALLHGDYIMIDSDLMSLDKNTRSKVIRNIREYAKKSNLTVVMKGMKGDEDLEKHVHEYISVQYKFLRVYFKQNKAQKGVLEEQKQQIEQLRLLEQKIVSQLKKFGSQEPAPQIPKELTRKLKLSLSTLKFYFQHRVWHISFVLSLAAMYTVGNYYNYFVNVSKPDDPYGYAWVILEITVLYIICIIFRSYLFAEANLKESQRICQLTNKLMVYNHISFYAKHNIIERNPEIQDLEGEQANPETQKEQQKQNSKNMNTEKLVCLSTSDQTTLNNTFPFGTNILWNNIATVIGSLIMVFNQVPIMILFLLAFVFAVQKIEKKYREESEGFVLAAKDQQVRLMKAVNTIDQGALYFHIYGRTQKFTQKFSNELGSTIQISNKESSLSIWVQANFRLNMILFLITSVILFWATFTYQNGDAQASSSQSAKLSVMVRYILLLADYVFYLTRSLAECRGKAISIQRVRRFVQNVSVIKGSFERLQRSNHKINQLRKALRQNEPATKKQFINLYNFNYQYNKRGPNVLENINLRIKSGDRIVLKGKTGAGKTTLFKVLMGLYPEVYFPESSIHLISFSSQHPLKMGQCSILQKLDPYKIIDLVPPGITNKVMEKMKKVFEKSRKTAISYEEEVLINNMRAYLYGFKGLAVYDEPQVIVDENSSYIVVTHHGKFKSTCQFKLERGRILELTGQQKQRQNA